MGKNVLTGKILIHLTISLIVILVLSNTIPPWEYVSIKPADEGALTKSTVLKFEQPKVSKSTIKDYYTVSIPDTRPYLVPGAPIVPVKVYTFKLPYNCEVKNVKVDIETKPLKGQYKLLPGPKPVKLDSPKPEKHELEMFEEDPSIYESDKPYPEKMFEYEVKKGIDPLARERVTYVVVRVFPVQYVPKKGSLTYASKVEIRVDYRDLSSQVKPLQQYVDLVIITSTSLQSAAQTLANWKSSQGYTVWIRTVDWISSNYPGYDTPEKIRNFLIDVLENYDVWYVIILGDNDQVPARRVYSSEFEWLAENNPYIESDLYYADLDGTWDTDNDHKYGEMQDDVDGYPDVLVGRLPASTIDEANAIVNKLMNYNPTNSWFRRVLLLGTVIFENTLAPEGEIVKDFWEAYLLPANFSWTKLYEGLGNLNPTNVKNEIKNGYGIVNFAGHGNTNLWYFGEGGFFLNSDVYQLANGFNTPVVATMACLTNDFADTDVAISEAFMIHPNGGAIAYLGAAEVAYGYVGYYVIYGLAGMIDWAFLAGFKFLEENFLTPTPGFMHMIAIMNYLIVFGRSWALDWFTVVEYGTLLGDPTLPLKGTGSPPPPPPTPVLRGCTLDRHGNVVTNVLLRLYNYTSGDLLYEKVEDDGCYEFVDLSYGTYRIEASAGILYGSTVFYYPHVTMEKNVVLREASSFNLSVEDTDIVQGVIRINITVSNDAGLRITMVQYCIYGVSDWIEIPAPIDGAYDEDIETVHIEIDGYSYSPGVYWLWVRAFAEGGFESSWIPWRAFTIRELSKRYNLISLTLLPEPGYSASSLARAIGPEVTLIASWDTATQKFKGYVPGVSGPGDDFPIELGFGYFVYLTSPRRLVEFPGW